MVLQHIDTKMGHKCDTRGTQVQHKCDTSSTQLGHKRDKNATQVRRHKIEWFLIRFYVPLVSHLCRAKHGNICVFCVKFVSCRTYCFCCNIRNSFFRFMSDNIVVYMWYKGRPKKISKISKMTLHLKKKFHKIIKTKNDVTKNKS